jgi:hypothetical protein
MSVTLEAEPLTGATVDQLCINTIRTLSIDAVHQAKSGHPGTPMALAPLVYTLWNGVMRFDPQDPIWPGRHRNTGTWEEARDPLNQILRGWSAYFSYGTRARAYGAVDNYVYKSVRHFLRRRHQVHTRGTHRFSIPAVFGESEVLQLRQLPEKPHS